MSVLAGKHVLLGITAGIAAYKSASLVRLFVKSGAEVKVIMTPSAREFVTPLTLSTLSKNPVLSSFTSETDENAVWNNHVELGLWADLFVIAPVTANTLSKMADGRADNLLIATYLSAKCPVYFAPAMDLDMHKHQSTINSITKLESYGNILIPSESGELASGLVGEGRMAEPETIISNITNHILSGLPFRDYHFLITAGPTYEPIDPVRFVGNHSSGKMGFEIAKYALELGANVSLVTGPTHESLTHPFLELVPVTTAAEMYDETISRFASSDIAILSAAVADYKPKMRAHNKIKKTVESFNLEMEQTKDILATLGNLKDNQILVGFALETENELNNAITKLKSKNLDLIVLNSLNDKGAGFGGDTNKVSFINSKFEVRELPLQSKSAVACDLLTELLSTIDA